ncbi:uncharacterized protein Z519_01283 [Cladophialophora bantiana CBS 173.52]|uniref:Heterokaryon incompatibility domain-containing protein n=1 Tax=Cladophialophora bantiana (strain ATCC 10958 / CBS 173.52 / CDC B-1940 / NIH 8579) TaxID=1442370 RepID=A0A0D2ILM4_CLAB1|nr:uncharacterized protein Z519_01283 [Cladophialophora bantiana CBS 173.52]KIW97699.1 hypothetical protein Z519_01283 [Cladophialophora bantiana CBS 173.52]
MEKPGPPPSRGHASPRESSVVASSSAERPDVVPATAEDALAGILQSMNLAQQEIASGNLTADQEIASRTTSASITEMLFGATQDPTHLAKAIQHYQAIIRLLKTPSLERAKFLDRLAYVEMTSFSVSKSMEVLDSSITHSKQARDEALLTNDPSLCTIYHNLGYSISHRAQLTNNATDLDEAICCGREILKLAHTDSQEYQTTTVNLGARLHARYKMRRQAEDAEEALLLLEKQLKSFPPGSAQHGSALLVRAYILHDRFEQTKDINRLDSAIAGFVAGLTSLGMTHERRPDVLLQLSLLHHQRYKQSGDKADLDAALGHSRERLQSIPSMYQIRPDHVSDFLSHLVEYVYIAESMDIVESALEEARLFHDEVPKSHTKRHCCNLSLVGILSKKYLISHDIKHLRDLVSFVTVSVGEWNEKLDITRPKFPSADLFNLSSCLETIERAAVESPVRQQALARLLQWHIPIHESRRPFEGLIVMCREHGHELESLCRHLASDHTLSQRQIDADIDMLRKQEAIKSTEDEERWTRSRKLDQDDYTDSFFGHRKLAIDPHRKRIVFSAESLVKSVLGYTEDEDPKSWANFEALEARLEDESFAKEKLEGKSPNPNLCRVCRHVKLLKPMDGGGFTWGSNKFFPFGTYSQLLTRKHCSICRLILSLDTVDGGHTLHPHLAQIDRETQGTQFHAQLLPSGEVMLGVEYGMTTVGALRLLKPDNLSDALRQPCPRLAWKSVPEHLQQAVSTVAQGDERVDFGKIRSWLYECNGNHGELCNSLGNTQRYAGEIPLILIDVQDNCLVQASSAERYFTLSYAWGKVKISQTINANIQDRFQKSSMDPSQYPNTIRDAMIFVRSLGERYLWTDALCIIQDDATMKERDIGRMDIVYKKVFTNIVALAGHDANAGLPGVSPNSRAPQRVEVLSITSGSTDLALREDPVAETDTVRLVSTPQPLAHAQTSSTWNTRGWVLQGQTLARRNIYFSPSYVYFQCSKEVVSETMLQGRYTEEGSKSGGQDDPGEDADEGPAFTIRNPITELRKIDTFSGMLSAFKDDFQSETLCGLPIAALDLGLLWSPTEPLQRRPGKASTTSSSPSKVWPSTCSTHGAVTQDFPTWSWAGWVGASDYRLLPLDKEPPPDSLVGEFFIIREGTILRLLGYQRPCSANDAKASPGLLAEYFGRISMDVRQAQKNKVLHFMPPFVDGPTFSIVRDTDPVYLSSSKHIHLQTRQAVVRIYDKHGKHCGILFEHIDYHSILRRVQGRTKQDLESLRTLNDKIIIAISQSRDAYAEREGLTRVEGDVKRFDAYEFRAQGPGSGLVNVLVLRPGIDAFERIAVGQIHSKAWEEAGPRRSWIKLG